MKFSSPLIIFNMLVFTALQAVAAPTIDKIHGVFTEGETLTISGSNFGSHDAIPLLWDTVDNQITGNSAINQLAVPTQAENAWSSNTVSKWGTDVVYDTNNPRKGRNTSYAGGKRSDLGWANAVKNTKLKNIFVSWWFWVSEDPQDNGGSNKFIRIWDHSNGEHTRVSWTSMHFQATNSKTSWNDWGGNVGQWNRLDIWVSDDTHTIKAWMNNKLMHHLDDFFKADIEEGFNIDIIGFDPSVSDYYPDLNFKMSDIYISPSIARVEVSDKAQWEDISGTREIQPVQSWSDNKIVVSLNAGAFDSISSKYLYVVDGNGVANSDGILLCSKCPEAPNLGIE